MNLWKRNNTQVHILPLVAILPLANQIKIVKQIEKLETSFKFYRVRTVFESRGVKSEPYVPTIKQTKHKLCIYYRTNFIYWRAKICYIILFQFNYNSFLPKLHSPFTQYHLNCQSSDIKHEILKFSHFLIGKNIKKKYC